MKRQNGIIESSQERVWSEIHPSLNNVPSYADEDILDTSDTEGDT